MIRFCDILISIIVIIFFIPFSIFIALFILMDSRGPVFFCQDRIGLNEKPFLLFKFRTMRISKHDSSQITLGLKDARITAVGKILRKYKIDEFPQFVNVLLGDMSIVGPRPELEKYTKIYNQEQKKIFKIRPGITDWASIKYINEAEILENAEFPELEYINVVMPQKLLLNKIYLNNYGLLEYFGIIFTTARYFFRRN